VIIKKKTYVANVRTLKGELIEHKTTPGFENVNLKENGRINGEDIKRLLGYKLKTQDPVTLMNATNEFYFQFACSRKGKEMPSKEVIEKILNKIINEYKKPTPKKK